MPNFKKSEGFQLKSGNTINTIGSAFFKKTEQTPSYYKAPLHNEEEEKKKKEEEEKKQKELKATTTAADDAADDVTDEGTTVESPEESAGMEGNEVNVDKKDTGWQAAGKIFANSIIGGLDSVYGTKTKKVPSVQWSDKEIKQVKAESPEEKVDKLIGKPSNSTTSKENPIDINNANQMGGGDVDQENINDDD